MNRFIEVVGTGNLVERVVEYRADVTLLVRAPQAETAIREALELRSSCIRTLKAAGLSDSDLKEGGAEVRQPWFWKKKPGQEATQKLLIACTDLPRLMNALSALEPLFENQRFTLSVSMGRPRFEAQESARRQAERAALADASTKAGNLAGCSGLRLTGVTEVEELDVKSSRSGAYGDQEWGVFAAAGGGASDGSPEPLDAATRDTRIRYRVRFAVEREA